MLETIDPENILAIDDRSAVSLIRDTLLLPWQARRSRIDTVVNM